MVHAHLRKLRRKNHIGETGRRISQSSLPQWLRRKISHIKTFHRNRSAMIQGNSFEVLKNTVSIFGNELFLGHF